MLSGLQRRGRPRHRHPAPDRPLRLLLVGGGHANIALLKAARRWTQRGAEVTLINDTRYLHYSGMTPEYLGGVYRLPEIRIDLLRWCLVNHVRFIQTRATSIDLARKTVHTQGGDALECDLAVFDVGAANPRQARAGGAVLTKPLHHTLRLESWLDDVLTREQAGRSLVVVGGGAAGCEVMLNLSARHERHVQRKPSIHEPGARPDALRLTLVHSTGRLMPQFAANLGRRAEQLLRRRGVELRLGCEVSHVEDDAVVLQQGERLPQDLVVWATGTRGHDLFARSAVDVDERGYVRVDRCLRAPAHPWLFAAGDCARVEGRMLERSGVNAVKQGLSMRANVDRLVRAWQTGQDLSAVSLLPFRPYPAAPYLISTGANEALLALGPRIGLRGPLLLTFKHLADRIWISRYHFTGEQREKRKAKKRKKR